MAETRDTRPSILDDRFKCALGELEGAEPLTLFELVWREGYMLVIDPNPQERPDALGSTGWRRIACAQLCKGRVIAITEGLPSAAYCVSHELAHGRRGFDDEKDVLLEQADILARWVGLLLNNVREGAKT